MTTQPVPQRNSLSNKAVVYICKRISHPGIFLTSALRDHSEHIPRGGGFLGLGGGGADFAIHLSETH